MAIHYRHHSANNGEEKDFDPKKIGNEVSNEFEPILSDEQINAANAADPRDTQEIIERFRANCDDITSAK